MPYTTTVDRPLRGGHSTGHRRGDPESGPRRRPPAAAERYLATRPAQTVWIWSGGPAGGGASITVPSGAVCNSTRAELVAVHAALEEMRGLGAALEDVPVVLCTDSQAALAALVADAGLSGRRWVPTSGAGCWTTRPDTDRFAFSGSLPTTGCQEMRRTSWQRILPASYRMVYLWTSAASLWQSAVPPPRSGGTAVA